jgi:hypothetical protein
MSIIRRSMDIGKFVERELAVDTKSYSEETYPTYFWIKHGPPNCVSVC